MTLKEQTDEELMQELQAGNSDAFDTLFNRYYIPLQRYLSSRIREDTDSADDVCQTVFLRIHKHKHGFQAGQLFRPWFYAMADRLAKNANRDYHRRKKHTMRFSDFDRKASKNEDVSWYHSRECIDLTEIVGDGKVSGVEVNRQAEIREAIPKVVLELPVHLRQVVQFVLTNGASLRKAEEVLCIGRRTLSKRLEEACTIIRSRINCDDVPENGGTLSDLRLATVRDLIDMLPFEECEALHRVVLGGTATSADFSVLCNVLDKLLGNVSTKEILV